LIGYNSNYHHAALDKMGSLLAVFFNGNIFNYWIMPQAFIILCVLFYVDIIGLSLTC